MQSITPCQRRISDRFPVASFAVNVPPNRLFEIVCATDPHLLTPEHRGKRSAQNFFTSRTGGLLRAPAGQATYLVPPTALRRFAGRQRLYFALATYGSQRGDDPRLSVGRAQIEHTPSIMLSADFTGRTLDRSKFRGTPPDGRYGAAKALLTWGGDAALAPAPEPPAAARAMREYDDGFSPDLWRGRDDGSEPTEPPPWSDAQASDDPPEPDPAEQYEEMGHSEAYGRRTSRRTARAASATPVRHGAEPTGFEDAIAMRGKSRYGRVQPPVQPQTYGSVRAQTCSGCAQPACTRCLGSREVSHRLVAGEPPGAEDGRALAAYGGGRRVAGYGHRGYGADASDFQVGSPIEPPAPPPMPARVRGAVDDEWREDDGELDLPSVATDGPGDALTIRRKFEIIMPVLLSESGEDRYGATIGSVEYDDPTHSAYQRIHYGVHWGIASFNQRSGALGQVLRACAKRDNTRFAQHFGESVAEQLLAVTTAESPDARLAPVGGALLWSQPWLERFQRAGEIATFQAAQNEVAIERYVDRNLGFASALGLVTDRALAMMFDRTINMGIGAARGWILAAVSPLTDDSKVQQAAQALGHADLTAFQQAAGLAPTGRLGSQTHAALLAALRGLGERSPVRVPSVNEMLDRFVTSATGRKFEARVRELRGSTSFTDAVQRVI